MSDARGLTAVSAPCLVFYADADAKCDNPEERLFWDGIHPTKVVHDALAERALEALGGS